MPCGDLDVSQVDACVEHGGDEGMPEHGPGAQCRGAPSPVLGDRTKAMRPRIWLPATAAAVSLTLLGCGGSGGSDEGSAPEGSPEQGTCWAVPAHSAIDWDYEHWVDDSPQVPCMEPHTTETAAVVPLKKSTVAEAKKVARDSCWNLVAEYLAVDLSHWVHWTWAAFLPSREEIADGASWIRCDAVFPTWDFSSVRSTTAEAEMVAVNPPAELWACLDENPQKAKQPLVPCDQPHEYEQTGSLSSLTGLDKYPSPAELTAAAKRQCTFHLPEEAGDVAVTARWDPTLQEGYRVDGACFMFNKNGQPLPPGP